MSLKIRIKIAIVIFLLTAAAALIFANSSSEPLTLSKQFFEGLFYGFTYLEFNKIDKVQKEASNIYKIDKRKELFTLTSLIISGGLFFLFISFLKSLATSTPNSVGVFPKSCPEWAPPSYLGGCGLSGTNPFGQDVFSMIVYGLENDISYVIPLSIFTVIMVRGSLDRNLVTIHGGGRGRDQNRDRKGFAAAGRQGHCRR